MATSNQFIVVAGGANVDVFGKSEQPLVSQDSNPGRVQLVPGGVARNVAENLARLGIETRLVSAVGDDEHGRLLLRACRDAGIDTDGVRQDASCPTSTYLAIIDSNGDMEVAVSDMTIVERIDAEELNTSRHLFAAAALAVLDTNLSDAALGWAIAAIDAAPLFVDTVSTAKAGRIRPFLSAIDTLKASRLEAGAVSGIAATDEASLRANADWFHERGVDRLFVTLGEDGVFYSTASADGILNLESGTDRIVNASGAGDAFLAGLAYARIEDLTLEQSLDLALAAAKITAKHPGTNNPELSLASIAAERENDLG